MIPFGLFMAASKIEKITSFLGCIGFIDMNLSAIAGLFRLIPQEQGLIGVGVGSALFAIGIIGLIRHRKKLNTFYK